MKDNRKPYTPPKMEIKRMEVQGALLVGSESENPWWRDEQPSADEWWQDNNKEDK